MAVGDLATKAKVKRGGQPKIRDVNPKREPKPTPPTKDRTDSRSLDGVRTLWARGPAPRSTHYPLTSEEVRAVRKDPTLHTWLIQQYQAGRRDLEPTLLQVNGGFIEHIAAKYDGGRYGDWLDIRQEARIGLLEGCARFDPSYGVRPLTYLNFYVRSFVKRFLRDEGAVVRIPNTEYKHGRTSLHKRYVHNFSELPDLSHDGYDRPFEEALVDPCEASDELVHEEELAAALKPLATHLTRNLEPRERDILWRRYMTSTPATFTELGESLSLSRERIRQLETKGLGDCRVESRRMGCFPEKFQTFEEWVLSATFALAQLRPLNM